LENSGDITVLLRQWGEEKGIDADQLFKLIYPRLRAMAGALMRRERPDTLLQPTSVVNELFLKLVQQRKLEFENRQHFYSFAARLMRRILVDYARGEDRHKRDGGQEVPLEDHLAWFEYDPARMVDLDEALADLEALDPRKCRMVELRFLLGFTVEETADLMSVSTSSVDRDVFFARSWLRDRLTPVAEVKGRKDAPTGVNLIQQ
jgi:RNA polymerase sigma factor (TIGR02999 family)